MTFLMPVSPFNLPHLDWIIFFFICCYTILDIKTKEVPVILTTPLILITALVYNQNIMFGVLGFIFAYMLLEGLSVDKEGFYSGIADLKALILISLTISTISGFMFFMFLTVIYGLVYKEIVNRFLFKDKFDQIAFMPAILLTYITLLIVKITGLGFGV